MTGLRFTVHKTTGLFRKHFASGAVKPIPDLRGVFSMGVTAGAGTAATFVMLHNTTHQRRRPLGATSLGQQVTARETEKEREIFLRWSERARGLRRWSGGDGGGNSRTSPLLVLFLRLCQKEEVRRRAFLRPVLVNVSYNYRVWRELDLFRIFYFLLTRIFLGLFFSSSLCYDFFFLLYITPLTPHCFPVYLCTSLFGVN